MKQRFLEILWRSRDWDSALSLLGVQVCFLVRELRSCKLCSMAKHTHTHTHKTITAPVKFTCILAKETNNKHNK